MRIEDTLGAPLNVSLAWANRADGFVAIWGAGLAKYRWAANKPGLVVTGHWNREHRGDLHIYDDPLYMESPTPVIFAPSEIVKDRSEALTLIDLKSLGPSYFNFSLDYEQYVPFLFDFIKDLKGRTTELEAGLRDIVSIFHGSIDCVGYYIEGWAATPDGTPAQITIEIDGRPAATLACDINRPDVHAAGFPTATAGFSFALPPALLDGAPHDLAILFPDGQPLPFNPATGVAGPLWRFQFTPAPVLA